MPINKTIRLWLVAALLTVAGGLRAAEDNKVLRISYIDDNYVLREALFSLETNPVVTFDEEQVVITSTQTRSAFQIENVDEMTFVEDDQSTTSMDEIEDAAASNKIVFRILADDVVKVVGAGLRPELTVHTADGKMVQVPVEYAEHEITIRLGTLSRGLYIINTNQHSFKFIRK